MNHLKGVKPTGLNSIHCRAGSYRFPKQMPANNHAVFLLHLDIDYKCIDIKIDCGGHVICIHNSDLAKKTIQTKSILLSLLSYELGKVKPTSSSTHFQIDTHAPFFTDDAKLQSNHAYPSTPLLNTLIIPLTNSIQWNLYYLGTLLSGHSIVWTSKISLWLVVYWQWWSLGYMKAQGVSLKVAANLLGDLFICQIFVAKICVALQSSIIRIWSRYQWQASLGQEVILEQLISACTHTWILCNIPIFSNIEVSTKTQYYIPSPTTKTVMLKYCKHWLYCSGQ